MEGILLLSVLNIAQISKDPDDRHLTLGFPKAIVQVQSLLKQGPPSSCNPNETKEWRPFLMCGTHGESVATVPGEFRCANYYDYAKSACVRQCFWTGRCQGP
jgi:hypothetical protein